MLTLLERNHLRKKTRHLPAPYLRNRVLWLSHDFKYWAYSCSRQPELPFLTASNMLCLTFIWFAYSQKLLTMATLVCMTGSYNLLGKIATKCHFLYSLYQNIFFFKDFQWFRCGHMAPAKRSFIRKNIIKETHTCSIVMGLLEPFKIGKQFTFYLLLWCYDAVFN